jgi:transcription elongation factor Elf1
MADLTCRRCKHALSDVVQYGNRGPFIRCDECGLEVRVYRGTRQVEKRARPRMTKKERRRERQRLAADEARARAFIAKNGSAHVEAAAQDLA